MKSDVLLGKSVRMDREEKPKHRLWQYVDMALAFVSVALLGCGHSSAVTYWQS